MIQFPSEDLPQPELTPEPEISTIKNKTIEELDYNPSKKPEIPEEIIEKKPEILKQLDKDNVFIDFIHEKIAKPLIGPPAPGHTTFSIELQENKVSGFYQLPSDTRSLKELGPFLLTKTEKIVKLIKERDFKKDIKNLKTLPSTIKKIPAKVNVDSLKQIPKKIRGLFSSD